MAVLWPYHQSRRPRLLNPPAPVPDPGILKDGDQDRLAISLVAPTAQVWSASVP